MIKDERFSMSAVLKYRKNTEDEVARETASLKKMVEEQELLLMDMERRKESVVMEYRAKKSPTVEEVKLFQSFLSIIEIGISSQKKNVSEVVKDYNRKREELTSAAVDKKIMENIRDREWEEHNRMVWFLEQKELDEIATNSYCRGI